MTQKDAHGIALASQGQPAGFTTAPALPGTAGVRSSPPGRFPASGGFRDAGPPFNGTDDVAFANRSPDFLTAPLRLNVYYSGRTCEAPAGDAGNHSMSDDIVNTPHADLERG